MRIIVLGAGGIGSLVGGFLSKNNDVLLVGRENHVNEINKNGLIIKGAVNENFKVEAATKIDSIDENDLIILSTKATNNEKTLNEIKNLIKKNNTILCLQNGIGNEDKIRKIVDCTVLRGIITAGTVFLYPGKIECSNLGDIFVEESNDSEKIVDLMNKSGLKAQVSPDINDRIWKKLIANCVMNPLTAIFRIKNGELAKCPDLIKSIVHELILVANKESFNYSEEEVFENIMDIIKESKLNKSSMLQDIVKGRKTEIDFLNGAVVELGKKRNINCPVNRSLVEMVKFLENKNLNKGRI